MKTPWIVTWQYINGMEWACENESMKFLLAVTISPSVVENLVYEFCKYEGTLNNN